MGLGPQTLPPEGARSFVANLFGGRGGGPDVSATVDESDALNGVIEFLKRAGAMRTVCGASSRTPGPTRSER